MGTVHMESLNEVPEIELAAVVDPYEKAAVAAAKKFQIPQSYTDATEMLKQERPDYVVVVSPPLYHAEQTIAAYEAGAHVLCEKPLCMSVGEAEAMRTAAQKSGKLFTMGLQLRQMHMYDAARQFLAAGKLGNVFHSRVWAGHIMEYPAGRFFHKKEYSLGGVFAGTVVHFLDLAMWILGSPQPLAVSASIFRRLDKMSDPPVHFDGSATDSDVEDFVHGHVRFADGSSMSLEGSWLFHPCSDPAGVEIDGVDGVIRVKEHECVVELEEREKVRPLILDHEPEHEKRQVEQHRVFVEAMKGNMKPAVSFDEAIAVQKIVNGIYDSASAGYRSARLRVSDSATPDPTGSRSTPLSPPRSRR